MSTIQSLKNFIRHGKQARLVTPHAEPTTNVSPIHAQHQRQPQGASAAGNLDAIDSKLGNKQDAGHQKSPEGQSQHKSAREAEIEKIVAEERQISSQMPKYPGLERWVLLEKMGDGAFSNVYRAKDATGPYDQVAIKVVRKYEMNSTQVGSFPFVACFCDGSLTCLLDSAQIFSKKSRSCVKSTIRMLSNSLISPRLVNITTSSSNYVLGASYSTRSSA